MVNFQPIRTNNSDNIDPVDGQILFDTHGKIYMDVKQNGETTRTEIANIDSGSGGGQSVSYTQTLAPGTEIGKLTIDGQDNSLYCQNVSYEPVLTQGTELGKLTIGSTTHSLFCSNESYYVIPAATKTTVGGIKVDGTNFLLDTNNSLIFGSSVTFSGKITSSSITCRGNITSSDITCSGTVEINSGPNPVIISGGNIILKKVNDDTTVETTISVEDIELKKVNGNTTVTTTISGEDIELKKVNGDTTVTTTIWDLKAAVDSCLTEIPVATTAAIGGVKIDGTSITINENGVISSHGGGSGYTLPTASSDTLGGVKIDKTSITITTDGVISVKDWGSGASIDDKSTSSTTTWSSEKISSFVSESIASSIGDLNNTLETVLKGGGT